MVLIGVAAPWLRVLLDRQELECVQRDRIVRYPVSTAANGPGEQDGSFCTPRGWHVIRARIGDFEELRAARIDSRVNPAHPLANAPERYAHVNGEPDRCLRPEAPGTPGEERIPPPSRSDRGAGD